MGFGLVAKSLQPNRISLIMFGFSQVAIDLQQLYKHLTERVAIHGVSHCILGATFIGLACIPFRSSMERLFNKAISFKSSIYGIFIGVYSHLILDSIVHPDVSNNLFRPFAINSHLFGLLSKIEMNLLCVLLGIFGLIIMGVRHIINRKKSQ